MVDGYPNVEHHSSFEHDGLSNVHDAGTDNHDHANLYRADFECLGTPLRLPKNRSQPSPATAALATMHY